MSGGSHAREREPRSRRPLWIVLVVLLVLLGGGLAWRAVGGDDEEAAGCDRVSHAEVAASPDIAPVLTEVATTLRDEGGCADITVASVPADQVLNLLTTRSEEAPDVWVPDSDVWAKQLAASGIEAETIVPAMASSPVVLAGGPAAAAPASWLEAATSGQLEMLDPADSTASALALIALRSEKSKTGVSTSVLKAGLVTAAQHYSSESSGRSASTVLSSLPASSTRVVPVTEQQFLLASRDNRRLQVMVPKTGAMVQDYPVIGLPDRSDESRDAVSELLDRVMGDEGDVVLAQHGFRDANASPLPDGRGVGTVDELALPGAATVERDLRSWQVLAVPSSLLVVLDASGSMDFETTDGTRMELATGAANEALAAFPARTRIGLWVFSVDQGGDDVDHRVMAPLRRLDADVDGSTQRLLLGSRIEESLALTDGGTGLYDTALAAYRDAVKNYDDDYFNSVVLMTDGANDDPGSIELDELLSELRAEADPAKPVRIVAIGISEDADMDALGKIAEATGGQAFAARDPRDILGVVQKTLLAR